MVHVENAVVLRHGYALRANLEQGLQKFGVHALSNSDWAQGFAARLKVLLERFGTSKAEMARQCGLPPRTLENYFKGHKPGIEVLIAISRGLKVDIDWLIGEESTTYDSFNSDMVGEAAARVIFPFLSSIANSSEYGGAPIENGIIFGRDPGEMAHQLFRPEQPPTF